MTAWCGTSTWARELKALSDRTGDLVPIGPFDYADRLHRLQAAMRETGFDAVFLDAGTTLAYFTGVAWHPSERLAGALVRRSGDPQFVVPFFERGTFGSLTAPGADIRCWHEHESPAALFAALLEETSSGSRVVGLDPQTPFARAQPGPLPPREGARNRALAEEHPLLHLWRHGHQRPFGRLAVGHPLRDRTLDSRRDAGIVAGRRATAFRRHEILVGRRHRSNADSSQPVARRVTLNRSTPRDAEPLRKGRGFDVLLGSS